MHVTIVLAISKHIKQTNNNITQIHHIPHIIFITAAKVKTFGSVMLIHKFIKPTKNAYDFQLLHSGEGIHWYRIQYLTNDLVHVYNKAYS